MNILAKFFCCCIQQQDIDDPSHVHQATAPLLSNNPSPTVIYTEYENTMKDDDEFYTVLLCCYD